MKEKKKERKKLRDSDVAGTMSPPFKNVSFMFCVVSFNPAPDVLEEMNHCFII